MVSFRLAAARRAGRFGAIDALRGLAIVAMVIYHLSWDFSAYGIVAIDVVNDPWWKAFAHLIAGNGHPTRIFTRAPAPTHSGTTSAVAFANSASISGT